MGLLNRASQGRTYDGKETERKGILDNISWEMQEEELVKKIACDNLTTGTTLFVHESQMAFFFKDRCCMTVLALGNIRWKPEIFHFCKEL